MKKGLFYPELFEPIEPLPVRPSPVIVDPLGEDFFFEVLTIMNIYYILYIIDIHPTVVRSSSHHLLSLLFIGNQNKQKGDGRTQMLPLDKVSSYWGRTCCSLWFQFLFYLPYFLFSVILLGYLFIDPFCWREGCRIQKEVILYDAISWRFYPLWWISLISWSQVNQIPPLLSFLSLSVYLSEEFRFHFFTYTYQQRYILPEWLINYDPV